MNRDDFRDAIVEIIAEEAPISELSDLTAFATQVAERVSALTHAGCPRCAFVSTVNLTARAAAERAQTITAAATVASGSATLFDTDDRDRAAIAERALDIARRIVALVDEHGKETR